MDVGPGFAVRDHYEIPDALGPEDWIKTNPEAHEAAAPAVNEEFSKQWKPLVKMVKKWNAVQDKPVSPSFLIEVMATDFLHPPWGGRYAREIKSFMATLGMRLDEVWSDLAGLSPPVSDRMGSAEIAHARQILTQTDEAIDRAMLLDQRGNTGGALRVWHDEIFGDMFPLS